MINITYIYVKRKIFLFSNENIVDVDILIALIIFIHVDEESDFDFILVFIRGPKFKNASGIDLTGLGSEDNVQDDFEEIEDSNEASNRQNSIDNFGK